MNEEESKVWDALKNNVGKQNSANIAALSTSLGISERKARDILRDLRIKHGKLIGSTLSGGYFICSCLSELKECFATALNYENHNRENRQFFEEAMKTVEEGQVQLGFL